MANVDPVSGNEVPPGGTPKEVRDDIPIKASEGEYMLPADVVKYFGLDYIEKLIIKAKTGMEELQANGRIGGSGPDDLPFSPEELQAHEEEMAAPEEAPAQEAPMQMASGGFVSPLNNKVSNPVASSVMTNPNSSVTPQPNNTPVAALPTWMSDDNAKISQTEKEGAGRGDRPEPTGFGRQVKDWSPQDYSDYADSKTNPVRGIADKVFSTVSPIAGMAIKGLGKLTDKTALTRAEDMLKAGKDQLGNPLTPEDRKTLETARDRIAAQREEKPSMGGGLGGIIGDALGNLVTKKKEKAPETRQTEKNAGNSKDKDKNSSSSSSGNSSRGGERTGGRSMAKGGLVTRR